MKIRDAREKFCLTVLDSTLLEFMEERLSEERMLVHFDHWCELVTKYYPHYL